MIFVFTVTILYIVYIYTQQKATILTHTYSTENATNRELPYKSGKKKKGEMNTKGVVPDTCQVKHNVEL